MISGPKGPLFEEDKDMGCPRCKGTFDLRRGKEEGSVVWIHCLRCEFEFALRQEAVPKDMKPMTNFYH